EILLAIQPDDLCRYFNELAFGVQVPGPDDRPTLKRANGILFEKKAISWYMPRNNEWDLVDEKGNPTISLALNNLIKQVARWELRGEGLTAHLIERLDDRADPSTLILEWMFTANGQTGRDDQLKTDYSRSALKRIVALDEFEAMGSVSDIGTHSFRKCPCTYAQRRGSTKDDANARGRWAMKPDGTPRYRQRRQVDTYTSNLMP
ncbi:hypothetical protein SARC_11788, partial [Sphaeroforma arctica JP610]